MEDKETEGAVYPYSTIHIMKEDNETERVMYPVPPNYGHSHIPTEDHECTDAHCNHQHHKHPMPKTPPSMSFKGNCRNEPCPCGSGLKFKKCCGK